MPVKTQNDTQYYKFTVIPKYTERCDERAFLQTIPMRGYETLVTQIGSTLMIDGQGQIAYAPSREFVLTTMCCELFRDYSRTDLAVYLGTDASGFDAKLA